MRGVARQKNAVLCKPSNMRDYSAHLKRAAAKNESFPASIRSMVVTKGGKQARDPQDAQEAARRVEEVMQRQEAAEGVRIAGRRGS